MKTRKELKEEYKNMKPEMGVFQIRNIISNKVIIDSSINMLSKWNRHKAELNLGSHRNKTFLKDWNEYGEENFQFEILTVLKKNEDDNVDYRKELKILQKMIVDEIKSDNFY